MFQETETTHFFLKEIVASDQAFIFKGLSDSRVIPFYGVQYSSFEEAGAQMEFYQTIRREQSGCHWKIVSKLDGEPVGVCGINSYSTQHEKAEIGYWLLPEHWQKGIMREVMPVFIDHIFRHWKIHRLEAVIEEGNEASCRLSETLGFTYEGLLRESEIKRGKRISLHMYSLLASDPRPWAR